MIFKAQPKLRSLEVCEFTGDVVEMQEFGKPFIIGDTTLFFNGSAGPIIIQPGNFIVKMPDGNLQLYTRENFLREFIIQDYMYAVFSEIIGDPADLFIAEGQEGAHK